MQILTVWESRLSPGHSVHWVPTKPNGNFNGGSRWEHRGHTHWFAVRSFALSFTSDTGDELNPREITWIYQRSPDGSPDAMDLVSDWGPNWTSFLLVPHTYASILQFSGLKEVYFMSENTWHEPHSQVGNLDDLGRKVTKSTPSSNWDLKEIMAFNCTENRMPRCCSAYLSEPMSLKIANKSYYWTNWQLHG